MSPVYVQATESVPSACGCYRGRGEREDWNRTAPRVKGHRDRGVKRLRVSHGSLCRSLVPAVHSCSSSSLSAGCTAARWCLLRGGRECDEWEVETKNGFTLLQPLQTHPLMRVKYKISCLIELSFMFLMSVNSEMQQKLKVICQNALYHVYINYCSTTVLWPW